MTPKSALDGSIGGHGEQNRGPFDPGQHHRAPIPMSNGHPSGRDAACAELPSRLRVEGRVTWYEGLGGMQVDLDLCLAAYNTQRPHRGREVNGYTP